MRIIVCWILGHKKTGEVYYADQDVMRVINKCNKCGKKWERILHYGEAV